MLQRQYPLPKPPIGGATVQQTYVFAVNQPSLPHYARLHQNRYIVPAPLHVNTGATKQQTYIFPPNQPSLAHYSIYSPNRLGRQGAAPQVNQGALVLTPGTHCASITSRAVYTAVVTTQMPTAAITSKKNVDATVTNISICGPGQSANV